MSTPPDAKQQKHQAQLEANAAELGISPQELQDTLKMVVGFSNDIIAALGALPIPMTIQAEILTRALIATTKPHGIDKETAVKAFSESWDDTNDFFFKQNGKPVPTQ